MVLTGSLSLLLRALYITYVAVMLYWFSLDLLKWFDFESGGGNTEIVSFNWHPLLMSFAMLVFESEAVISFRTVRDTYGMSHTNTKIFHTVCHSVALVLLAAGLGVIFDNHGQKGIKHLYSAHSWLGIGAVSMMVLQASQGALVFLYGNNNLESSVRAAWMPIHKYFGLVIYFLSCATILLGLQEKAGFLAGTDKCKADMYCIEIQLANLLAVLVVFIAGVVGSLLYVNPGLAPPSENSPLMDGLNPSSTSSV